MQPTNSNTQNKSSKRRESLSKLVQIIICTMFGTLMFCSKAIMAVLPNIHLLGMFIMVFTLVFRFKALISISVFVLLEGLFSGFPLWWIPYIYVWAVLWVITMLLPKRMPKIVKTVVYPVVCALHGLAFGCLYAPAQALLFGLDFNGMVAWIIAGFPFDIIHAISNFVAGLFILPLSEMLIKLLISLRVIQK